MSIADSLSFTLQRQTYRKNGLKIKLAAVFYRNVRLSINRVFSMSHCSSVISTPRLCAMLIMCFTANTVFSATDKPNLNLKPLLGRTISNYKGTIVSPDGSGLPEGSGSVAAGKLIYASRCAACHGVDGTLAANPLVGGMGSLASSKPLKTVGSYWPYATTLIDYIARAMPYNQEKTLDANEVYAVAAYVLMLNGIVNKDTTLDASSILKVKMPNSAGFIELHHSNKSQ